MRKSEVAAPRFEMTFFPNCGYRLVLSIVLTALATIGCEQRPPAHVLTYAADPALLPAGTLPDADSLAAIINNRLARNGRARAIDDDQVAVEIFRSLDPAELESIKRLIGSMGTLEFRITAQAGLPINTDVNIINTAVALPASEKSVVLDGEKRAEWVTYSPEEFGPFNVADPRIVKRLAGNSPEALVLIDSWNVTGQYIRSARTTNDESGRPAVSFELNNQGATRFAQLTGQNLPNPATGGVRHLGILLDKRLISAPSIRSPIHNRGQISGGAMTSEEVDRIVAILHTGALPYPIKLISETTSPTIATTTLGLLISPVLIALLAGVMILVLVVCITLIIKMR